MPDAAARAAAAAVARRPAETGCRAPSAARALVRRPLLCAALFAVVASFAGIHAHTFWSPDEPREAEMSREMLENHFSAMPTLGQEPFLEKPPLFFWMAAASYELFGFSEAAERLPAALCAALAILFAWSIARHAGGRRTALYASLLVASFSTFWTVGHRGINDVVLGAAVAGGHAALVRARAWAERGRGLQCGLLAGLACGVAFMAKGIIGPALIAGPATLAWLALRDRVVLKRVFPWLALFSGLFVAAFGVPWAVALSRHPGGWQNVYETTLGQAIGRTIGDESKGPHSHPVWFYVVSGWGALMPWALLLPLILLLPRARARLAQRPLLDAGLFFVMGVLLLSIPSGKRTSYLFPLLPVAAAVPAHWLARVRGDGALARRGLQVLLGLAGLAGLGCAVAVVLISFGWTPNPKVARVAGADHRAVSLLMSAMLAGLGAWCLRLSLRAAAERSVRAAVRELALFLAVGLVLSHEIGRRFQEPMNLLHPAARKIAAAVPANEPVIAYNASETLRAMVPFYGGRLLERTTTTDVIAELRARGARHLVVMNDSAIKLPREVEAKLKPVASTSEDEGFDTTIYEVAE